MATFSQGLVFKKDPETIRSMGETYRQLREMKRQNDEAQQRAYRRYQAEQMERAWER